jgi:hypothetical protein
MMVGASTASLVLRTLPSTRYTDCVSDMGR